MSESGFIRDDVVVGSDDVDGLRLDWAVACNVGMVREANEDAALVGPGRFLLADGMGGHERGEVASEVALTVLAEVPVGGGQEETRDELEQLLVRAQDQIGEIDTSSERRAGTTATGAVLISHDDQPHWLVFNIGDSRTYCVRDGVLEQVTVDHSQVQEFVDAGMLTAEQARVDPRRNVITRALGAGIVPPRADYFLFETEPGDQLLLCSDGLTGELPDAEIGAILADSESAQEAADALVEGALALGAHDNVTVVVVHVGSGAAAQDPVDSDNEGAGEPDSDDHESDDHESDDHESDEPVSDDPEADTDDA
ncbi:PP2C family protein-serine/threonine phosphatase [Gordonia crocea]|uniref:Serine/threonine protein phosphatase n=1 Tax=Gordonia crocea TaxID=589162 RepID=A0A7I9UYG9_9ACTN|nr:protein phosphatase 2C domain-containing protein [Gordonia crocea]GED97861.1 serine/threonine protein phosphatase [Gordonia crocea]